jgi:hypothetical protein
MLSSITEGSRAKWMRTFNTWPRMPSGLITRISSTNHSCALIDDVIRLPAARMSRDAMSRASFMWVVSTISRSTWTLPSRMKVSTLRPFTPQNRLGTRTRASFSANVIAWRNASWAAARSWMTP